MKKNIKTLILLLSVLLLISSFTGCQAVYKITAPKQYKEQASGYDDYPNDALPVYEGAMVYEYNEDDGSIALKFGSESSLEDISEYYMDYFSDNDIYLSSEKDRSRSYLADGEQDYYKFQLTLEEPAEKWEERLFSCIAVLELDKMNIPNKSGIYDYIDQVEENIKEYNDIYDTYFMLEDSEEEDMEYYINESENILNKLKDIGASLASQDVPDMPEFKSLNSTEAEIVEIMTSVFEDYKAFAEYSDAIVTYSEDYVDQSNTDYEYYYDMFEDIVYIYDALVDDLEGLTPPSFVEDFHNTFIEVLNETISSSEYCMDAIDYEDNVLFYAGLYSFQINFRDIGTLLIDFDADTETKSDRLEEDLESVKAASDGIYEWLQTVKKEVEEDSEQLSQISDEYIIHEAEIQVICDYTYPEKIIPANYRSMDNIAFVQLSTNKGIKTVVVRVEIPGFTQKFEQKVEITKAETEINVHPPLLSDAISQLNSSKDAQLIITVEDADTGELEVQDTLDVTLYSRYDMQWYDEYDNSYVENILAWMTPEAPEVSRLLRAAADSAAYLTDGELDSIVGYQYASDWNEAQITYVQAAALMHALATQMNVKYIMEPFSATDTSLQRVKTPAQVINEEGGLCAETSLVIASALQAMGMHPVLILPPGHMHVAVETWYGSGEYIYIETTALTEAANEDFDSVLAYLDPDQWDNYLNQEGYIVIDCALADEYGIKSID